MLAADGHLEKLGHTPELLEVIARYGDRAMTFVWEHKEALAVATTLTAFLGDPELFINGTKDLAKVGIESIGKPLAEVPVTVAKDSANEIAKSTNWTLLFGAPVLVVCGLVVVRLWRK